MLRAHAILLPVLLAAFSLSTAIVQGQQPAQEPPGWTPSNLEQLAQHAAFHTDFTFDRSMLRFASNFMDNGNPDTQRAVNKLDAISVHSFHFSGPGLYDPAVLESVRQQYSAAGWKHLVTARAHGDPFDAGQTDLWIGFAHADVTGMTVLLSGAKDIELISIIGDLSPLDLLHLRGHFGIPRFNPDGLAPEPATTSPQANTQPQPRPEYVQPAPAPPPPTPPVR